MTPAARTHAAEFFGTLWAALHDASATTPPIPAPRHYASAYDPAWLATLPLPIEDPSQPVDLVEGGHFERHDNAPELHEAYHRKPRTRIYVGLHQSTPWVTRVAEHLTRLTRSAPHVMATAYASNSTDATIGAHRDAWDGAIIQLVGSKTWQLGPGLLHPGHAIEHVTTNPGDILILPDGLPHAVTTPLDPGHSLHLVFAIRRRAPTAQDLTPEKTPAWHIDITHTAPAEATQPRRAPAIDSNGPASRTTACGEEFRSMVISPPLAGHSIVSKTSNSEVFR
jgi:hypothetical protein